MSTNALNSRRSRAGISNSNREPETITGPTLANGGYDPGEARIPAGQTGGGQWTPGSAGSDGVQGLHRARRGEEHLGRCGSKPGSLRSTKRGAGEKLDGEDGSRDGLMRSEVTPSTPLLVHFLKTGQQQDRSLGDVAKLAKGFTISIEVQGKVMIDVDGTGSKHGDPKANPNSETSQKVKGKSLNADKTAYAAAPRIMSWDNGRGLSVLKPGDRATITANGNTIEATVGDFGPNQPEGAENTTFGEISYKAAEDLGIPISPSKKGPVVDDYPVTIKYYPGTAP